MLKIDGKERTFSEGIAILQTPGTDPKNCFITKESGQSSTGKLYESANDFHEGLSWIRESGRYGCIDKEGRKVIDCVFDDAHDFSEGLAAVKVEGKWGYINHSGNVVIKPQFEYASEFSEGLAFVRVP